MDFPGLGTLVTRIVFAMLTALFLRAKHDLTGAAKGTN